MMMIVIIYCGELGIRFILKYLILWQNILRRAVTIIHF